MASPFALVAFTALMAANQPADASFLDKVDSVKTEGHGCPYCTLAGTNLSNQCLQNSDFRGADLDRAQMVLTCLSGSDLRNAKLRGADLSGANLRNSKLDGADFTGATLVSTSFKHTDLTRAKGLTQAQLDKACGDAETKAPDGMSVRTCQ